MIYIVMGSDGEATYVSAVFKDKQKAEHYVKLQKELEDMYSFYIIEQEFEDDNWTGQEKIAEYYMYQLATDDTIEESEDWNNDEKERCIDKGDTYTEVTYHGYNHEQLENEEYAQIYAYSKNSFKEAKELAIKLYGALKFSEGRTK